MYLVSQVDRFEEVCVVLEFHIKPTIRNGKSYIKVSSNFINKIKGIHSLLRDAILGHRRPVFSIPYKIRLNALK